jgi:hypothetical protein
VSAAIRFEIENKVQVITIVSKAASATGIGFTAPRSGETGTTASATCRVGDREEESEPLAIEWHVQPGPDPDLKNQTSAEAIALRL